MNNIIIATIITVSSIGIISSVILYWASQKFKVIENPLIGLIEEVLPSANCGGCGYPGCLNFAEACTKAENLDKLNCPVGGNETMKKVAEILGMTASSKAKQVAVILCNGSPANRQNINKYDGAQNCTIVSNLYSGETACQYGCIGLGECVEVCKFDAIHMNPVTNLPEVIDENCTACNACAEICPKNIIELRPAGPKGKKIYVACINKDTESEAKIACQVSCIACGNCLAVCPHEAITIENLLAYIHADSCKLCRKCVNECPTGAILEINFPDRKTVTKNTTLNTLTDNSAQNNN